MPDIIKVISKQDYLDFIRFPWKVHGPDSPWVPPLIKEQQKELNPATGTFYRHGKAQLFLALKGKQAVGRIAAIISHRHQEAQEEDTGFFGFFECIDDPEVANALLRTAEDWLIHAGMSLVRGPASFTIYDPCGITVKGHDLRPGLGMAYTPAYYAKLLENAGYRKAKDLYAFHLHREQANLELKKLQSRREDVDLSGFKLRSIKDKELQDEAEIFAHVFTEAWKKNWGAFPMKPEDFLHASKSLKPFLDKRLISILENNGRPIGIFLAVPDPWEILQKSNGRINLRSFVSILRWRKTITHYRVIFMGVLPEYQLSPAVALLIEQFYESWIYFPKMKTMEFSWIVENNHSMIQLLELIKAKPLQTFRVYEKFI
ncbi:MAG: hypothetical protein ACON39_04400 [Coraliomargaritaceae bacterium]